MNLMQKLLLSFTTLAVSARVWADAALPVDHVIQDDRDINTVWVVGNYEIIARGFNAIAMFFTGGSDSIFVGMMMLAAVISLAGAIASKVTNQNFSLIGWFTTIIVFSALFLPRTDVKVASYYDVRGSVAGGAVAFRKVDNIPIGLVYPMAMISNVGKAITERFDQAFPILSDTAITGGASVEGKSFLVSGAEGYFSPLKTQIRLVNRFSPSDRYWGVNLNEGFQKCNWKDRQDEFRKYGVYGVLWPSTEGGRNVNTSLMNFTYDGANGKTVRPVTCKVGGYIMSLQLLADVVPEGGKAYSYAGHMAASNGKLSAPSTINRAVNENQYRVYADEEIKTLPQMLVQGMGFDPEANGGLPAGISNPKSMVQTLFKQLDDGKQDTVKVAGSMLINNEVDTATIQSNFLINNMVSACFGDRSRACGQYTALMTEATNKLAIDSAGEASFFQRLLGHSMNILLFVYIVMAPIMMFVIMTMGAKGWKLVFAYILFNVWISSWLPITNAIGYYMMTNYMNAIHRIMSGLGRADKDTMWTVLSPAMTNQILADTQDMISTGSTMMASAPLVMLSLLSGSIYGMVSLAQRMGTGGKDFMNEGQVAPSLDQSRAVNMSGRMAAMAQASDGYMTTTNTDPTLSNSEVGGTSNISVSGGHMESSALKEQINRARAETASLSENTVYTVTYTERDGSQNTVGFSIDNNGQVQYVDSEALNNAKSNRNTVDLSAQLGGKLPVVGGASWSNSQQMSEDAVFSNGNQRSDSVGRSISASQAGLSSHAQELIKQEVAQSSRSAAVQESESRAQALENAYQRSSSLQGSATFDMPRITSYMENTGDVQGAKNEMALNFSEGLKGTRFEAEGHQIADLMRNGSNQQVAGKLIELGGRNDEVGAAAIMALRDLTEMTNIADKGAAMQHLDAATRGFMLNGMMESGQQKAGLGDLSQMQAHFGEQLRAENAMTGKVDMSGNARAELEARGGAAVAAGKAGIEAESNRLREQYTSKIQERHQAMKAGENAHNKVFNDGTLLAHPGTKAALSMAGDVIGFFKEHTGIDLGNALGAAPGGRLIVNAINRSDNSSIGQEEVFRDQIYKEMGMEPPGAPKRLMNDLGGYTNEDIDRENAIRGSLHERMLAQGHKVASERTIVSLTDPNHTAKVYTYELDTNSAAGQATQRAYHNAEQFGSVTARGNRSAVNIEGISAAMSSGVSLSEGRAAGKPFDGSASPAAGSSYAGHAGTTAAGGLSGHSGWRRASQWAQNGTRSGRDINRHPGTQTGYCASGVARQFIQGGFLPPGLHGDANDLFAKLERMPEWDVVAKGQVRDIKGTIDGFTPKDGMVAFISPHGQDRSGGAKVGHIAVFHQAANGGKGAWISDYYQGENMLSTNTVNKYIRGGSTITILDHKAIAQDRDGQPAYAGSTGSVGAAGAGASLGAMAAGGGGAGRYAASNMNMATQAVVAREAQERGIDPAMMLAIAHVETGGTFNPRAKNAQSGASGLFQFMPANFRAYGLNANSAMDAERNSEAAMQMTKENMSVFRRRFGREPNPGEVYMMHQQGAGGFSTLMRNLDRPAHEVLGRAKVMQNGGNMNMTSRQFIEMFGSKVNALYQQYRRRFV